MNCPFCEVKMNKYHEFNVCPECGAETYPGTFNVVVVSMLSKGVVKKEYRDLHLTGCFMQIFSGWEGNLYEYYGENMPARTVLELVNGWWTSKEFRKIQIEVV